jgi:hypothetical protein
MEQDGNNEEHRGGQEKRRQTNDFHNWLVDYIG